MTTTTPTTALAGLDLLPCPFCGSSNIDPAEWSGNDGKAGPGCGDCGALGETVEAWNRRAAQPNSPEFRGIAAQPAEGAGQAERHIKYLESLVDAYGPKSLQYDIEHPNDGLNSADPNEVSRTSRSLPKSGGAGQAGQVACKNEKCEGGRHYNTEHTRSWPCPDCTAPTERAAAPASAAANAGGQAAHQPDMNMVAMRLRQILDPQPGTLSAQWHAADAMLWLTGDAAYEARAWELQAAHRAAATSAGEQ